eukprot:TRINITY_DN210_c0_g1_i2.p1 TRINITY_DN210_c0_g1~~TRINITY_DN210_c0_g1_i2.p1  ORF type:complete len:191 (-),score=49.60 TRINITY_DN210_c0_g1_i2:467-1039(-)
MRSAPSSAIALVSLVRPPARSPCLTGYSCQIFILSCEPFEYHLAASTILPKQLRPEQIVPLTVGVVAIAQGLDMLINPQRSGRFFDNSYVITDTDKTSVSMIGARELIKGLAIAGIAINSDGDSLRLANAITLGSTVIEEGVDQLTARADGFRGVSGAYRNLNSAFRVLVSCATLWTMWSLKGKPTPDDY